MTELPILECRSLVKRFGRTVAVNDVSLALSPGQSLGLVGENGAGKTTLLSMMAGELRPDAGTILLDGREQSFGSAHAARRRGIAVVHQELSLFPDLTVAENIAMTREPVSAGHVDVGAMRSSTAAVMDRLGVSIDVRALVRTLSPAQQQIVEIAKALYWDPRVLILDEPTSSLESHEVSVLHDVVRKLVASGTSVVFVSHRLDEVFDFTDTIAVMRDGRLVDLRPTSQHTHDSLVANMVGREIDQVYPERRPQEQTEPLLELRDVSAGPLRGVSLAIPAGVIVGVGGLEGQGQHTLAEIVAGARKVESGEMRLMGRRVTLRSPHDAIRRRIVYVPPDRGASGLMLPLSIKSNVAVAALDRLSRLGVIQPGRERRSVLDSVRQLQLRFARLVQPVSDLSGGNQQKVLFARWLMVPSLRVLVLDDPTRGVDIGARAEIYTLLGQLTDSGIGVLLISTDLMELLGLADVIHVMYEGRIVGTVPAAEATEQTVMRLATGASDAA